MENSTPARRIITLSDRRPVSIIESEWPVIASVSGNSYTETEPSPEEPDKMYTLTVRKHADGRHIIYGTSKRNTPHSAGYGNLPDRAGYLIKTDEGKLVESHIIVVSEKLGLPNQIAVTCIASLAPDEL